MGSFGLTGRARLRLQTAHVALANELSNGEGMFAKYRESIERRRLWN